MMLKNAALKYREAGLSPIPVNRQTKAPVISWKQYQTAPANAFEIEGWFASNYVTAIGIACGEASGNLEIIDFDNVGEQFLAWVDKIPQDIYDRLVIQQTQRGGYHAMYRCETPIDGNLKLSQRRVGDSLQTLIETRGQGGQFLVAPTPGYTVKQGDISQIATISPESRTTLLEAAWSLNEYWPEPAGQIAARGNVGVSSEAVRPGDDYNDRGDVRELLQSHGWQLVGQQGDNERWRRPGKTHGGHSATMRVSDRLLYVFSSNAYPFESGKTYFPFGVFALLECRGDYHAATELLGKSGYGEQSPPPADYAHVDISGILEQLTSKQTIDPGPTPETFFEVPGFIAEVIDYTLKTSPYPNLPLAFCGAMALQSWLAGRRIMEPCGIRPNIYLLALANTGTGKDRPRKVNKEIAELIGEVSAIGEDIASGEGLQDLMSKQLNMLYQTDEIDGLLRAINKARDARHESIMGALLKLYTSSDSYIPMRSKAGMETATVIRQPSLTLLGTAPECHYYDAMSERMLTNGLFSRMLIIDVGDRSLFQPPARIDIPDRVKMVAQHWADLKNAAGNLAWENPQPATAEYSGNAGGLLFEFQRETDAQHQAATTETQRAIWTRAAEQCRKLALLYACSETPTRPTITEAAVRWATDLVGHQIRRQLFNAENRVAVNEFDETCIKAKDFVRKQPTKTVSRRQLSRALKMKSRELDELIKSLVEQGEFYETIEINGGRPSVSYRLLR